MIELVYNNIKNIYQGKKLFKLKFQYHSYILLEKKINSRLKTQMADLWTNKLGELLIMGLQNFVYTSKLQKKVHVQGIKFRNETFIKKISFYNKSIKKKSL